MGRYGRTGFWNVDLSVILWDESHYFYVTPD